MQLFQTLVVAHAANDSTRGKGSHAEAGLGYTAPNWIGALLAATGLAVSIVSGLLDRKKTISVGERVLTR